MSFLNAIEKERSLRIGDGIRRGPIYSFVKKLDPAEVAFN